MPLFTDKESNVLDPVVAYDALASCYKSVLESRRQYLQKVEEIVVAHIGGAESLLDVGAGEGTRTLRIGHAAGITRLVLLEPSAQMRNQCHEAVEYWPCRASEIPETGCKFDVITCLWNVVGHLQNSDERSLVLSRLRTLLKPNGTIFLDVNHRYNAAAYGRTKTFLRMVHDLAFRSEKNGDVIVRWQVNGHDIRTRGHVFRQAELAGLFRDSGLKIRRRWVINYQNGLECRLPLAGNLLYQLEVVSTGSMSQRRADAC